MKTAFHAGEPPTLRIPVPSQIGAGAMVYRKLMNSVRHERGGNSKKVLQIEQLESRTLLAADLSFAEPIGFFVGSYPEAILATDVSGDGILDLVTADSADDSVSILLGTGSGTFAPRSREFVGHAPVALTAGDVDQDRQVDLVVANLTSNDVSVLLGSGGGDFDVEFRYPAGEAVTSVLLADVNEDNQLDLITANSGSPMETGSIVLLRGGGPDIFHPPVTVLRKPGAYWVDAAEF